jgi:hypothetical protein
VDEFVNSTDVADIACRQSENGGAAKQIGQNVDLGGLTAA